MQVSLFPQVRIINVLLWTSVIYSECNENHDCKITDG